MKLHGQVLDIPNVKIIPIIRDTGTIYLSTAPVKSFDEFLKVCPIPEPPMRELPGGEMKPMVESKEYKAALEERNRQMLHYMIIKSLEATDGLTWDTVDLNDPSTYKNYADELMSAGFTAIEITRIVNAVMQTNSLDEDAIDHARADFLASQRVQAGPA
jgi:hypothetical protein